MPTPNFLLSAKDRLWLVLETHEGKWQTVDDLMFDAGFVPKYGDNLTPFTSFYWNLCQLEDAGAEGGYQILQSGDRVVLCRGER